MPATAPSKPTTTKPRQPRRATDASKPGAHPRKPKHLRGGPTTPSRTRRARSATCRALPPSSASSTRPTLRRRAPSTASRSPTRRCRSPSKTAPGRHRAAGPGSVQLANHVVAGAAPAAAAVARATGGTGHNAIGLAVGPLANAGPGLLAFPRGMSNALLVSAARQRQRPSARGDGTAGVLLLPADPDGGGHPRTGDRRRRRGLPGRQPVRRARPRPGLRVVGDLGGPEHHRHVRRAAVQSGRRQAGAELGLLRAPRPVRADGDADAERVAGSPNLADSTPAGLDHDARPSGPRTGS